MRNQFDANRISRRAALGAAAGASVAVAFPLGAGSDEPAAAEQPVGGASSLLRPVRLTTEYADHPLGIDSDRPRFGWQLEATGRDRAQSAYRILVASTRQGLRTVAPDVWDSGRVASAAQSAVVYDGPSLRSMTRYHWAVRVWDESGRGGRPSKPAWFETALLTEDDWSADWIGSGLVFARPPRVASQTFFDGVQLRPGHTLGQSFRSESELVAVAINLVAGEAPAECVMTLRRDGPAGTVVAEHVLSDLVGEAQARLDADRPIEPGLLYVEVSEPSGMISWQTAPNHPYDGGSAFEDGQEVADQNVSRYLDGIPPDPPPNPVLRTEFELPGSRDRNGVTSARLYIAGLGHAVAWINGQRVGDAQLNPPTTDYDLRVLYTTHDVTPLLQDGGNAIGIALGRGFFASRAVDSDGSHLSSWIAEPQVKAQLVVVLADGERMTVGTGDGWLLADGPTVYDGLYTGETYDARRAEQLTGWTEPGFDGGDWRPAAAMTDPGGRLQAFVHEPVRAGTPVEPVEVSQPAAGVRLYDFGVVLAGWVRLRVELPAGTTVRMLYAEKLGPSGRIEVGTPGGNHNPSVVGRFQVDEYIAAGDSQSWQPSFTYKGFRYVEVSGTTEPLDVAAVPVHSDVPDALELRVEHPVLQWIADAGRQTNRNALHGLPDPSPMHTKLGWTGNTHFAGQPMMYLFGMAGLFGKWLDDIRLSQAQDGNLPIVTPVGRQWAPGLSPTWTGVYPHLVYRYWRTYGDETVPAKHFDAVSQYVEWASAVVDEDFFDDHFGDWFPPGGDGNPQAPEGGKLVGTAYVIKSLREGTALAELLGYDEEATAWRERTEVLITRFNDHFLDVAAGRYRVNEDDGYRQTSNAIPLAFDLVPAEHVATVAANLAAAVEEAGRLDTGCAGISALPYALTDDAGRADLAHLVLSQREYPSYGYLRDLGATTFWESWEPESRGHNDHLWSSPLRWLVERVVGVESLEPGWARVRIAPRAFGDLPSARAELDTVRGRLDVAWRRDGDSVVLELRIPVNAVAEVELPDGEERELGSGTYRFTTTLA